MQTALSEIDLAHWQTAQELLRRNELDAAARELARITDAGNGCADVLQLRWEICSQLGDWEAALASSQALTDAAPDTPDAWLCHACSLTELGRAKEAFEVLKSAQLRFPQSPAIAYNLACCACKSGSLESAKQWLQQAISTGGRAEVKLMALGDPDLAPLLDYLCAL